MQHWSPYFPSPVFLQSKEVKFLQEQLKLEKRELSFNAIMATVPRNTNCLYLQPGQVRLWDIKAATKPGRVTGWVCSVSVGAVTPSTAALNEMGDAHQPSLEITCCYDTCPTKLPLIQHLRSLSHSKGKAWVALTYRPGLSASLSPWQSAGESLSCPGCCHSPGLTHPAPPFPPGSPSGWLCWALKAQLCTGCHGQE